MSTRTRFSTFVRLAVGAALSITASGCGSELLRTGRAPVYLTILSIETTSGADDETGVILHSDVQTMVEVTVNNVTTRVPTTFDDSGVANIRVEKKNEALEGTSAINSVTITRYRVSYRRADGRSTPGVDVPYPFDGGTAVTIQAESSAPVSFQAVRQQAKLEPPLRNMVGGGGLAILSTIADVTFYGRDQNGNEVVVTGSFDVQFADFGDEQ
jgi:hypothetical protein